MIFSRFYDVQAGMNVSGMGTEEIGKIQEKSIYLKIIVKFV